MNNLLSEALRLDKKDNVLVARKDFAAGTFVLDDIVVLEDIPAGYKIAAQFIKKNDPVIKFNTVIGHAMVDCPAGTLMHIHNIAHERAVVEHEFCADVQPVDYIPQKDRATFMGIVRQNGKVATRNYIGVFIVSNCAATVARKISQHFTPEMMENYPNVDGVVPFITELGCGMELTGEPMDLLQRTMSGHIRHPNIAASLIVALGCERNNIDAFFAHEKLTESETCRRLVMQEVGGTKAAIDEGITIVSDMLPKANAIVRTPLSAEHLVLALECGGSDGFSGISANPGLGKASDLLVRNGGTVILSETPEIYGVHHTLTRRAITPEVGKKLLDRIDWCNPTAPVVITSSTAG
jgi:altronate hydrolase